MTTEHQSTPGSRNSWYSYVVWGLGTILYITKSRQDPSHNIVGQVLIDHLDRYNNSKKSCRLIPRNYVRNMIAFDQIYIQIYIQESGWYLSI